MLGFFLFFLVAGCMLVGGAAAWTKVLTDAQRERVVGVVEDVVGKVKGVLGMEAGAGATVGGLDGVRGGGFEPLADNEMGG